MRDLVVIGFTGERRANHALSELRRIEGEWTADLEDAVTVYRDDSGNLRIQQSYELGSDQGPRWGALWGSLIGAALALPLTAGGSAVAAVTAVGAAALTGGALGATASALDGGWWHEEVGVPEAFVQQLRDVIQPGNSAVLALLRSAPLAVVEQHGRELGGVVLHTSLSPKQAAKVEAVLQPQTSAESRATSREAQVARRESGGEQPATRNSEPRAAQPTEVGEADGSGRVGRQLGTRTE